MTGFRIAHVDAPNQKRPRVEKPSHLDFIRQLPCIACGHAPPSEAAHIRSGSRRFGKRETGLGEKPSDFFTLPLCKHCHRLSPQAQHSMGEAAFYTRHGIDPFATALALWAASGDLQLMGQIVAEARG